MISAIVLLDKPLGMSSNRALQTVKRMLGAAKAGHVGSLDPLASGMLPICLDEATKVAGEILSGRKHYRFEVTLGARTATGDREGEVVQSAPVPTLSTAMISAALASFIGPQSQVPPMYSAIKQQGEPLYRLARAGIEVERKARSIEIFSFECVKAQAAVLELETVCSKGTYVRTLAEDLARSLGSCGHVSALRRLSVEPFEGAPMETLETIDAALSAGRKPRFIAPDEALPQLPAVTLPEQAVGPLRHGQPVSLAVAPPPGKVRLYAPSGLFIGLGEAQGSVVRPRRLLALVA